MKANYLYICAIIFQSFTFSLISLPSLKDITFIKDPDRQMISTAADNFTQKIGSGVERISSGIETSSKIFADGISNALEKNIPLVGKETRETVQSLAGDTHFVLTTLGKEVRDASTSATRDIQTTATNVLATAGTQASTTAAAIGKELRASMEYTRTQTALATTHTATTLDRIITYHTKGIAFTCSGIMGMGTSIILLKNGIDKIIESKTSEQKNSKLRKQGYYYTFIGGACMTLSLFVISKSDSLAQFFTKAR